ncbi:hypothetical protein [Rhizobacter sp. LjRoot28]|jgi:hypothetical protein|uniref:hypothetical protein n=1 Tax=Rhizobacter sp. LjRoot28 TaxID=3342309 RepID=UPI003ECFBF76
MTEAANGVNGTTPSQEPRRRARKKTAQPPKARAPRQAERWIPIDDLTLATVTRVRAEVQKRTKMRPDLSMVIAAMLQHAAESPTLADAVARHGLDAYARALDGATAAAEAPSGIEEEPLPLSSGPA